MTDPISSVRQLWAILGIVIGIILVLFTAAFYLSVWLPRVDRKHWVTQKSRWRAVFGSVPWPLYFIYGFIALLTIVTVIYYAHTPPNW
jgi:hypothetical protein